MKSEVKVVILPSGTIVTGYNRITWRVSMVDKALPFAISVSWGKVRRSQFADTIKIGHIIGIYIDDSLQFIGEVEDVVYARSRDQGKVLVASGRDLYGSAVFSDADPRLQLANLGLEEQVRRLLGPLKLSVSFPNVESAREAVSRPRGGPRSVTSATPRIRTHNHKIRPGETIAAAIDNVAKKHGVIMWTQPSSDPNGGLLVCVGKPSYSETPKYHVSYVVDDNGNIASESNCEDMRYRAQVRTVPTQVFAYGRSQRGDTLPARTRTAISQDRFMVASIDTVNWTVSQREYQDPDRIVRGFFERVRNAQDSASGSSDPSSSRRPTTAQRLPFSNSGVFSYPFVADTLRPRIKHLHTKRAKDPRTGEQEARSYIARAMAKMRSVEATVQGFKQEHNGTTRIWAVNSMCVVRDDDLGISEDMMIQEIEFDESRTGGQTTKLVLSTKGALDLEPEE